MIRLLDQRGKRMLSPLYLMMLYSCEITHLPELVDAFGDEHALKFLDLFAGMTIRVPQRAVIEQAMRDVRIWMEMTMTPEKGPDLATEYALDADAIARIYRETAQRMEQLGVGAQEVGP